VRLKTQVILESKFVSMSRRKFDNTCPKVLIRGVRKGQKCGRTCKDDFCSKHKPKIPTTEVLEVPLPTCGCVVVEEELKLSSTGCVDGGRHVFWTLSNRVKDLEERLDALNISSK
jgi:hypothetical protein